MRQQARPSLKGDTSVALPFALQARAGALQCRQFNPEPPVQQDDSMTTRQMQSAGVLRIAGALRIVYSFRIAAAFIAALASSAAHAQEQPTPAMLEPVNGLVSFMSTLRRGEQPTVFARRGVCIVENFAPYLFCGLQAAANWAAAFRAHAAADELKDLNATFGAAHDFSQSGKRVYFSLPTTWAGQTHGRHFDEQGAWAFVLEQENNRWKIIGYGWGVTAASVTPP